MSSGWFVSDASNACAVPWKLPWIDSGMPRAAVASFTAETASPSETPGARLNDSVTTGNWPWWLIESGAVVSVTRVTVRSGTAPPSGPCR